MGYARESRPRIPFVFPLDDILMRRMHEEVGKQIRIAREAAKLTQGQLGKHLGLTYQQIQKYEIGTNRISLPTLWLISKILNADMSQFFKALEERFEWDQSPRF